MKKVNFGGGVTRILPTPSAPNTRSLVEKPITPEDVNNVVNITFTVIEAIKILFSVIKGWFKKK